MTTILLVEDEPGLARVIRQGLESWGYVVLSANDAPAALRLLGQSQVDLVILDWVVPALGGFEALRHLRRAAPVPLLLLAANHADAERWMGLELRVDEVLIKPFTLAGLEASVETLLHRVWRVAQIVRSDRQTSPQSLVYQGLVLNMARRQAIQDEHQLELTRLEFDLLALLLRNPGRVFSRAYLSETLCPAFNEAGCSLDEAVQGLRRKLGVLGEKLESVLGMGYRWRG